LFTLPFSLSLPFGASGFAIELKADGDSLGQRRFMKQATLIFPHQLFQTFPVLIKKGDFLVEAPFFLDGLTPHLY